MFRGIQVTFLIQLYYSEIFSNFFQQIWLENNIQRGHRQSFSCPQGIELCFFWA